MIFSWLKNRRRQAWLAAPLSDTWIGHLQTNVRHYRHLAAGDCRRVEQVVRVMVAEKHFCGGGGLQVNDEIKVTIAGQAAVLTLGQNEPYFFDHVQSIVVHPGAYAHPPEMQSHHLIVYERLPIYGEAWHHGPIVLSWHHVRAAGRGHSGGMNVVFHEFAHHLDGLNGEVEGTPPLAGRARQQTWYRVTEAEYLRLVGRARRGEVTLLDHYGATNRAEFFAVATECFFERPHALRREHGELYGVLGDFYQQDPAAWLPDAAGRPASRGEATAADAEPAEEEQIDPFVFTCDSPTELFTLGVEYLNQRRYRSAEAAFSRVLQSDPDDAEAYAQRAEARMGLQRYEGALEDSQRALQRTPGDVDALRTRGGARVALGRYEQGLDDLNRVPPSDRDAETHFLRGLAWLALDRPRRAVRDFTAAIRRDPHDAEAYYHRSQAHRALGRAKKAEADLERALQLDPHVVQE